MAIVFRIINTPGPGTYTREKLVATTGESQMHYF